MKTQRFSKLVDVTDYEGREVSYKDYDRDKIIKEEMRIELDGAPTVVYCKAGATPQGLREALQEVKYNNSKRNNGIKSGNSALFGSVPRNPQKFDFCRNGALSKNPIQAEVLEETTQMMNAIFQRHCPTWHLIADKLPKRHIPKVFIQPRLFIPDTVYTSGIVNYNNPMQYHRDGANLKGVLSTMLVLRNGMDGGYLVFPEYRLAIECKDGYVVIFDGKTIMHGVSELIPNENVENPYRISIVGYTMEGLAMCEETHEKELESYRQRSEEKSIKKQNKTIVI